MKRFLVDFGSFTRDKTKAILIFDDFSHVSDSDFEMIRNLFPLSLANEIVAFILTREKETADELINI